MGTSRCQAETCPFDTGLRRVGDVVPLHEHLRALRLQAGLTQSDLAGKLGIERSYLSRLERGVREVDMSVARRWARLCHSSLELVREEQGELLRGMDQLPEHEATALRMLVRDWHLIPEPLREDLVRRIEDWAAQYGT